MRTALYFEYEGRYICMHSIIIPHEYSQFLIYTMACEIFDVDFRFSGLCILGNASVCVYLCISISPICPAYIWLIVKVVYVCSRSPHACCCLSATRYKEKEKRGGKPKGRRSWQTKRSNLKSTENEFSLPSHRPLAPKKRRNCLNIFKYQIAIYVFRSSVYKYPTKWCWNFMELARKKKNKKKYRRQEELFSSYSGVYL